MKTKKNFLKYMLAVIMISLSYSWSTVCKGQVTHNINVGDTVFITTIDIHEIYETIPTNSTSSTIYLYIDIPGSSNFSWYGSCTANCSDSLIEAHIGDTYYCDFNYGGPQGISANVHYLPVIEDITMNYGDTIIGLPYFASWNWYQIDGTLISIDTSINVSSGTYYVITYDQGGYEGVDTFNITCVNYPYTLLGSASFCPGDSGLITLDSSELNVNYVLYQDSIAIDTIPGTGTSISLGYYPDGMYSCKGIGSLGGSWMTDSVILSLIPSYQDTINLAICQGDSIMVQGEWLKVQGTYFDTLATIEGCDSIIVTQLTVNSEQLTTVDISICDGDSTLVYGNWETNPGSYYDTLQTYQGCDSIIVTDLSVNPTFTINESISICEGDSVLLGGAYQTTTDSYSDSLITLDGCDSVIVTDLMIYPTYIDTINIEICDGEQWFCGGGNQTTSGFYFDTLQTSKTCDSIIVTNLNTLPVYNDTVNVSICDGDSLFIAGNWQTTSGTYYDSLTTINGCDSVIVSNLSVNGYSAEFTIVIDSTTVTYSPIDTADIMFWEFGDGVTSNTIAPIMIYAQPGYYTTCLTANDTITGCQVQYCENIQVGDTTDQCFANFTSDADVKSQGMVTFQDNSQGSPSMWYWQFGDGNISTDQHPVHNYDTAGFYNVKLTVYNNTTECMDECERIIEVTGSQDCEADFSVSVNNNNRKAYFSSTSISNGNIVGYFWDFGDGNTSTDEDPMNHYQSDGYYSVCLSITTDSGCQNTTCELIQVGSNACLADFTWIIMDSVNSIVQFADQSIGNPNWWKWNFGDGGHADIPDTTYQYGSPGLYHVHYMIKCNGCNPSHKNDVVAMGSYNITGMFGHYVDSSGNKTGAEPYPITFMAAFWGDPSTWSWDFGDGNTENVQQYPTHIYADTGTYYVCLSISDFASGYTSTYCDSINVNEVITGTGNKKAEPELLIYPNPSDGHVDIQTNAPSLISVRNVLGQIVLEKEIQGDGDGRIFLSTPGIYLLVIQTDKQITTRKVIIE